jgi:hypothetical protein
MSSFEEVDDKNTPSALLRRKAAALRQIAAATDSPIIADCATGVAAALEQVAARKEQRGGH